MKISALGIDIGGTKIAAAVVGADGIVTNSYLVPTPAASGAAAILRAAIEAGQQVLQEALSQEYNIAALGLGTAGHVDHECGRITYASGTLPGWTGVALGREFQAAFQLPVSVENDVNAMALGEGRFGAGSEFKDVLYVTIGTGVGGALVHNGQLRRGATFTAGEIGHLVIDWDGERRCSCGQTGHLEAYTSGPAIAKRYSMLTGLDQLYDLRAVASRAQDGDTVAQMVLAEGARILGQSLGGLLNVLDPQALIIGGGVAELGNLWWRPLEAALRANPMPGPARIPLRRAKLGTHAVLIGAAWLALCEHVPDLASGGQG